MAVDTVFTMDTSSIKFGRGATREVGADMLRLGGRHVMVVTDATLAASETVAITLDALGAARIDAVLFDGVRVEPTDRSFAEAITFAVAGQRDNRRSDLRLPGAACQDRYRAPCAASRPWHRRP
jgi:hydroxyacid-oxoacid transhydrogenase